MGQYRLIDADGHLDERPEEMIHYLDEPLRSQQILVRVGGPLQGQLAVEHRARALLRHKNGKAYAPYRYDPQPEKWLEFADAAGIETAILYPSLGLSFGNIEDPELAWYFARGYNNWAHERYMKTSPRLRCMALIPWQDVPEAVKELRRAVRELGMPGAFIPASQLEKRLGDESFHPVFEEAERLGCFIAVHGSFPARARDIFKGIRRASSVLHHPISLMVELTNMIFGGVFENFPKLKVGFLEAGCGWILYLLDRMDEYTQEGRGYKGRKKPSQYVAEGNLYFPAGPEESLLPQVISRIGDHHLFFASDFPHEKSTHEEFIERIDEMFALDTISAQAKKKIMYENAKTAYSLDS